MLVVIMGIWRSPILLTPLFLVLLALPLVLRVPNPHGDALGLELHEAGHTVLFFIVQLALLLYLRATRPHWPLLPLMLICGICSMTSGVVIELVQPLVDRSRSWGDLVRNLLGILGATGVFHALTVRRIHWRLTSLVFTAAVLGIAAWPVLGVLRHQALRDIAFPLLMDFEHPKLRAYSIKRARAQVFFEDAPQAWGTNSTTVARVFMPADMRWPGFVLRRPQNDWSQFNTLRFEVFSPHEDTVEIAVNIYSSEYKLKPLRYKAFKVEPGLNDLTMDLSTGSPLAEHHITWVSWYSISSGRDLELFFDNLRLEKSAVLANKR